MGDRMDVTNFQAVFFRKKSIYVAAEKIQKQSRKKPLHVSSFFPENGFDENMPSYF